MTSADSKFKLAVIGLGSAGIQSLCYFLSQLDNRWEVTSIHSTKVPVVSIGESTTPPFLNAIEHGLDFDLFLDLDKIDGTLKLGTQYIKWRPHNFTNPFFSGTAAIHFNTFKLKDFAIPRLEKIWGSKFKKIEGFVSDVENLPNKAVISVDEVPIEFDFVIDCRGFSMFSNESDDYVILDSIVNRCLVHNKQDLVDLKYTNHIATPDGWMFEIPLASRTSYGYLFNDKITNVADAKKNFSKEISIHEDNLDSIEFKFNSYYCKKILQNRVMKNGNAAVFFEPMFANSLWLYNSFNKIMLDFIISHNKIDQIKTIDDYNKFNALSLKKIKEIHELIAYHYHGGSIYETDFWKITKKKTQETIINSTNLKRVTPILTDMVLNKHWISENEDSVWLYPPIGLIRVDKNFGYNYFQP